MKKLILTGNQIRLFLKIANSEIGLFPYLTGLLKGKKDLGDAETAEFQIEDGKWFFKNSTEMLNEYLNDINEKKIFAEQAVAELKELINQLNPTQSEESGENTAGTEEEK